MRRAIPAFVAAVIMVAAAQPAGAVDNGFRGWYWIRAHIPCANERFTRRVQVRFVSETVRDFYHPRRGTTTRFMYVDGELLPWQGQLAHRDAELRYDPATDTAVGVRGHGPQGCGNVRLRLIPIG